MRPGDRISWEGRKKTSTKKGLRLQPHTPKQSNQSRRKKTSTKKGLRREETVPQTKWPSRKKTSTKKGLRHILIGDVIRSQGRKKTSTKKGLRLELLLPFCCIVRVGKRPQLRRDYPIKHRIIETTLIVSSAEQKAKHPALNTLNDEAYGQPAGDFSGRIFLLENKTKSQSSLNLTSQILKSFISSSGKIIVIYFL